MKTTRLIAMAFTIVFFNGCITKQGTSEKPVKKPVLVSLTPVTTEKNTLLLKYSGTVEPSQIIPLNFRTSGTVKEVFINEGDFVKKGQLLATVDDADAQNLLEISQSKYQQAIDAYNRLKSVYEKGSLPEIKWVEMQTNLSQAKSMLELSKNSLEKCKLFSPSNGIVGARNIEPGMSSINLTGAPIEIVDIRTVYIKISVPENEINKIRKGLKTEIFVSALDNKKYEGEIKNISPVADKFSRTYNAKIEVKNPDFKLKPGMVCDVKLNLVLNDKLVLVPYQSVCKDKEGNAFVYLANRNEKRAKKQLVSTGSYFGEDIEILTGLKQGQEVVCEGKYKLSDNSLITW